MMNTGKYQEFMSRVGAKLAKVQDKMVMPGLRNEEAVKVHTIGRILQSSKNFFFSQSGDVFDPIESVYTGFSAGYSDVSGLEARGIEDITILGSVLSLIPFLAIERSMDSPEQTITFQKLIAMNAQTGISAGDTLLHPFQPMNLNVDLKLKTVTLIIGTGASSVGSFSGPIVKGAVLVRLVGNGLVGGVYGTLEGRDYSKDGVITWKYTDKTDPSTGATLIQVPTVTINYEAGTVTVAPVLATEVCTAIATVDGSSDADGSSILRVKPKFDTAVLIATPNNIILESSLESEAYRNKMMQNAMDAGMTMNMGEIAFKQLLEMYVKYVNNRLVSGILSVGALALVDQPSGAYIELDMSSYGLTSYAPTKDDMVQNFYLRMNTQLQRSSDHGVSAIVTGIEGANILANVMGRFKADPAFDQNVDGYVGTYNNVPVIRHRLVDLASEAKYINFYFIHKTPDGKAGPVAFGEYLPLYSTKQVLNFNNPTQFAQALFSYMGVKEVVPSLCAAGRIKYLA